MPLGGRVAEEFLASAAWGPRGSTHGGSGAAAAAFARAAGTSWIGDGAVVVAAAHGAMVAAGVAGTVPWRQNGGGPWGS